MNPSTVFPLLSMLPRSNERGTFMLGGGMLLACVVPFGIAPSAANSQTLVACSVRQQGHNASERCSAHHFGVRSAQNPTPSRFLEVVRHNQGWSTWQQLKNRPSLFTTLHAVPGPRKYMCTMVPTHSSPSRACSCVPRNECLRPNQHKHMRNLQGLHPHPLPQTHTPPYRLCVCMH
jgi:hypothetical protein